MSALEQQKRSFSRELTRIVHLDYLLHLPAGYDEDGSRRWPLILFLHGMGERGSDVELVKRHGIPWVIEAGADLPFVAISPQCPKDSIWAVEMEALKALLDHALQEYRVDADRVYLTGLSMGGYGTWHLASEYPGMFAAAAPVCGGALSYVGFPDKVTAMKRVPVWAFHGGLDDIVPPGESEKLVDRLRSVGGEARLTLYPDAGHDSWTRTYENPELYRWFLDHRRASP